MGATRSAWAETWTITGVAPWWGSWWAYSLYASLAILLLHLYVRLRIRQALEQQERSGQQRSEEQERNQLDYQPDHQRSRQTQLLHLEAAAPTDSARLINPRPAEPDKSQRITTSTPTSPFLAELQILLETDFNNSQFGVEEMAQAMGLSRVHLYRKIKALSGGTASELLRNYRLTKATYLLRLGHSVTETAYAVGFDSPAYFAKCFRDVYKTTPSDFQNQERTNLTCR